MAQIINFTQNSQPITITLASLANNAVATSSSIDNSANRFRDADFQIKIKTGVGTSATGSVCVMLLKSSDGGTTFDDADESNAEVLLTFNANTDATTFTISSSANRNGIMLAEFFKIAVLNETGAAFDATGGNFSAKFVGKRMESI